MGRRIALWLGLGLLLLAGAPPAWAHFARPLSLEDAVTQAMQRNVEARVATLDIARAEALLRASRAPLIPQLALQGSYLRLDHDRLVGTQVAAADNQFAANANLLVPLIEPVAWGRLAEQRTATRLAAAQAREIKRLVGIGAAITYLGVVTQWRLLDAARHAQQTAQAHFTFASQRYAGGVGNRLDVLRADEEYAGSQAAVARTEINLKQAQEALGILIDADGPYDIELVWNLLPALPSRREAELYASDRRANVARDLVAMRLAEQQVEHYYLRFLPTLVLQGGPFTQNPPSLTVPRLGWQAALVLGLPLFDGGLRKADHQQAQAVQAQAHSRLDFGRQKVRAELRQAYVAVDRSAAALAFAQRGQQSAAVAIELSAEAYRRGSIDNLQVIDAERRGRDAATAAILAEDALHRAHLEVLIAAGDFPAL